MDFKDYHNQVMATTTELRGRVDTIDAEQKKLKDELTASKNGVVPAEYKTQIDALQADLNAALAAIKDIQLATKRPSFATDRALSSKDPGSKAFIKSVKMAGLYGENWQSFMLPDELKYVSRAHMPEEAKALYAADAPSGGFFAGVEFVNKLIEKILLISQFRGLADVYQISGEALTMPSLQNDTAAAWQSEQATWTQSADPSLGMEKIVAHEMRGLLKVSQQNLEDSLFDLESFIMRRLSLKFAQKEGQGFITGTGAGQPEGILTNGNVLVYNTGSLGVLTADSLLGAMHSLKSGYRQFGTWVFTTKTLGAIRLMKDSQNRPLWQPFAAGGLPTTIYDRPYVEMPDMPEVTTGQSFFPVCFGAFNLAYVIADRVTMSVKRLEELYAEFGLIGFIARRRVGGQVVLPEAIIKIQTS